MRRMGGRSGDNDGGAVLVEFALALPLFLMLIFGVVEFGRFVAVSTAVETASREAARFGSAVGGTTPQYLDCAGIRNAGQRLAIITDITDGEIVIQYDSGPATALTADCQDSTPEPAPTSATIFSGDRVVVTVSETFQSSIPIVGDWIGTVTITSSDARTIFKGSL